MVYFSPWAFVFWYGNPAQYNNRDEIEFWKDVPTIWDETKADGMPGEYATIARRKGKDWFVGVITNNDARELVVNLGFLEKGKKYTAAIYEDGPAGDIIKRNIELKNNVPLKLHLKAKGGAAIHIKPQ